MALYSRSGGLGQGEVGLQLLFVADERDHAHGDDRQQPEQRQFASGQGGASLQNHTARPLVHARPRCSAAQARPIASSRS